MDLSFTARNIASGFMDEMNRRPWMIESSYLVKIASVCSDIAAGKKPDVQGFAFERREVERAGNVAVLPLVGPISHRTNIIMEIFGGTSVQSFAKRFREAVQDSSVNSIVIDVDSPGGMVDGVPELAGEILKARDSGKQIVAVANADALSAAYWIASAASELVVTPSGSVGSIGVFVVHEDYSKMLEKAGVDVTLISAGKHKTEGNPFEPLSDSAKENIQKEVDSIYADFTKAVAKNRGVTVPAVRGGFGQGRAVPSKEALAEGMVDRVATLADVLGKMSGSARGKTSTSAAERARRLKVMELSQQ